MHYRAKESHLYQLTFVNVVQSNFIIITDTEGDIGSVRITAVSISSGLNLEKMYGLSFPKI